MQTHEIICKNVLQPVKTQVRAISKGCHVRSLPVLVEKGGCPRQTVKMRPKVAPRRPRASQTPPKWSPKIFPNQIFQHFLGLFVSGRNFAFLFCSFVAECVCFLKSRPLKFMRPRSVLLTSTRLGLFRKKISKIVENPPETLPKSSKNRGKIKKNLKRSMETAKMSEESQKLR